MTDTLSKEHRSWNMSRIKAKNTKPEIAVRSLLHKLGYRFRLHVKKLSGTPDIVLPKHRTVIFIHGCFWHQHAGCKLAYRPKSRQDFWTAKFTANIDRHEKACKELEQQGWKVLTIWECETFTSQDIMEIIVKQL